MKSFKSFLAAFMLLTISTIHAQVSCSADFTYSVTSNTVDFTNTSTSSGTIVKYEWTFGDGQNSSIENPSHTYNSGGYYPVSLHITTEDSCWSSIIYNVFINDGCAASFTFVEGSNGKIIFTGSPQNSILKYSWSLGNGLSATGQSVSSNYSNAGKYKVCLTISDTSGTCTNTYCDSIVVQYIPFTCSTSFTYSETDGTVSFTGAQADSSTYTWSFGDGETGEGKTTSHFYTTGGKYKICLTTLDTVYNCTAQFCDSIVVAGMSPCYATFEKLLTSSNSYAFVAQSNNENLVFNWDFGDASLDTGIYVNHTFADTGWYYVCLTATDTLNTCTYTYCDSINILPYNCNPTFTFTENAGTVTFTAQPFFMDYVWNFGDTKSDTTGFGYVEHAYNSPGTYYVCVTAIDSANNCSSTFCDSVKVTTQYNCNSTFTYFVNEGAVTFIAQPISFSNVYLWSFGNGTVSPGTFFTNYTYTESGTYNVCLVTYNSTTNCNSTFCDSVKITIPVGIEEISSKASYLSLFPNPVEDQFSVHYELQKSAKVTVEIYDVVGKRLMLPISTIQQQGGHQETVNASSLTPGIYLIRMSIDNEQITRIFIKK